MMNILDVMTTNPVEIHRTDTLANACQVMDDVNCRHLLVTDCDGTLVGIVSDRDCRLASASPFAADAGDALEQLTVEQFMTPAPTHISAQMSIYDAASIMLDLNISALPVVRDDSVIGIVTSTDMLKALLVVGQQVGA